MNWRVHQIPKLMCQRPACCKNCHMCVILSSLVNLKEGFELTHMSIFHKNLELWKDNSVEY